jgi:diadenosine tetraphosphate (Ap4A) HIT family hydrolase
MTETAAEIVNANQMKAEIDNQVIKTLHSHVIQKKNLSQDFEDMKNARIASKQRLEQRFTNVYT